MKLKDDKFKGKAEGLKIIPLCDENDMRDLWGVTSDADIFGGLTSKGGNNPWYIELDDIESLNNMREVVEFINKKGGKVEIDWE